MEPPKFIVNVEAAIYNNGLWLMILRSMKEDHAGGTISMVGGKVDYTDSLTNTLEDALKREIKEEVGISIFDHITYIESKMFVSKKGNHIIDIVLLCKYKSGEPIAKVKDEVDQVSWMTIDEINNHIATPIWIKESMVKAEKLSISIDK